jgi:hypothetical protein
MTMGISRVAYGGRREPGDDYIDLEVHQLGGELGKPADLSLRRAKFESNVLSLDIAEIAQSLTKLAPKLFRIDVADNECADGGHLRPLRARRERPRCRAAEQRYERASPHGLSSSDWRPHIT